MSTDPKPLSDPETYDIIVIGAGVAGVIAALSAARLGSTVALVQDRPVLGGNSSNEIRVSISGAEAKGFNRNALETGILMELRLEERFRSPVPWLERGDNGQPRPDWDWILWEWAHNEPNLTLYLNARAREPVMRDAHHIAGIVVDQSSTARTLRLDADVFIDCSGDGHIAAGAGADFRMGREAAAEFGEDLAPEEADRWVNSPSLLFSARDVGHPVPFMAPEWARDYSSKEKLPPIHIVRIDCGYWWIEYGGTRDQFAGAEQIRDELVRIVYGVWDHIKNHGDYGAENYALDWVGSVLARRESRRFLGDHILTQNDLESQRPFPDRVAYGGWPVDCHPPNALEVEPHPPAAFWPLRAEEGEQMPPGDYPWGWGIKVARYMRPDGEQEFAPPLRGLYSIPLRSLYSRNIDNLMFAGRNISATHVAFGSTRVQATCGVMGQAAGATAHLAATRHCSPRAVGENHIEALQQQLLKDDCYIPDLENRDPNDLARHAMVTASSTSTFPDLEAEVALPMDVARGQMFTSTEHHIRAISLYLKSSLPQDVEIRAELLSARRLDDFAGEQVVSTASATMPAGRWSWASFPFEAEIDPRQPHWIRLHATPGIGWGFSKHDVLGTQRAEWVEMFHLMERMHGTHCFRLDPVGRPYEPANVTNGVSRAERGANLWISDARQAFPQWLELDLGHRTHVDSIYLTFDANLDKLVTMGAAPECARDYQLEYWNGSAWCELFRVQGNYQRRRIHRFDPVTTRRLRLVVEATNGTPEARVYEIRVYHESEHSSCDA